MVTSDHNPLSIELKKVEFDFAAYGTIGLESAFGALNSIFSTKKTIELLTAGKNRFGIDKHPIEVGNPCQITLFNPSPTYTFSNSCISSKSKNSLFIGQRLKGTVYGILGNNLCVLRN
jgi:dihydroorotase